MAVRILVIEDQYNNMRLILQMLEDIYEDAYIAKAGTGDKAMSIARTESFDLILSDISLPDMDGMQIARMVRELPHLKDTPIIAVSAFADVDKNAEFEKLFQDFIAKPIDEDVFILKVKKWMGDHDDE